MQYIQKLFNALFTILFFFLLSLANIQTAKADTQTEGTKRMTSSEYRAFVASIDDENKIDELIEEERNALLFYVGQLKVLKSSTTRAEYSNYKDWQTDYETTEALVYETRLRIQILTNQ